MCRYLVFLVCLVALPTGLDSRHIKREKRDNDWIKDILSLLNGDTNGQDDQAPSNLLRRQSYGSGSDNFGSGDLGSGSGNFGSGDLDSGNWGSGSGGSGNGDLGSGNQGSGNWGSGNGGSENGDLGSGNDQLDFSKFKHDVLQYIGKAKTEILQYLGNVEKAVIQYSKQKLEGVSAGNSA